ncbi:MAG: hypothetical protein QOD66_2898 [Solirubrobacteraceae bacterium]|nr:hypothetical protein [Solirubrobacteraceae bacterium]
MRLRLPQLRDAPAIRELLRSQGHGPEDLEAARLVRFDPRRRLVICATALIGSRETIVGIGAIDLEPGRQTQPDTLVVDGELTDGLDGLLARALLGRAAAVARTRAA